LVHDRVADLPLVPRRRPRPVDRRHVGPGLPTEHLLDEGRLPRPRVALPATRLRQGSLCLRRPLAPLRRRLGLLCWTGGLLGRLPVPPPLAGQPHLGAVLAEQALADRPPVPRRIPRPVDRIQVGVTVAGEEPLQECRLALIDAGAGRHDLFSSPVQSVTGQYCCSVSYGPSRSRQSPHFACAAGSRSGETMAKKARKKPTSVRDILPLTSLFDQR